MTNIFKSIITKYLEACARRVISREHPRIVGITGSVGKTSTKEAVACVLGATERVGKSEKSYNSEIGLPLAILGLSSPYRSVVGWIHVLLVSALRAFHTPSYPRTLVLEMGVDKPRDMDLLLRIVRPHIAVMTAIGDTPVHMERFQNAAALVREKAKIFSKQSHEDWAILNYDDDVVRALATAAKGKTLTYGFHKDADIRASEYKLLYAHESATMPEGITFKVEYKGSAVPVRLYGALGRQQVYNALAAAAVGIARGMNLIAISEALRNYESQPGRLRVIDGVKGSHILDDTYNASPLAVHAALDTLGDIKKGRAICVLGDMLELGAASESAHREIGKHVSEVCDNLFIVGPHSYFIADEAIKFMPASRIIEAPDAVTAGHAVEEMVGEGDIVLVKGSQSIRMELAVEEIMAHPEQRAHLLVRQEDAWKETQERGNARFLQQLFGTAIVIGGVIVTPFTWPIAVVIVSIGVWTYRSASRPYLG